MSSTTTLELCFIDLTRNIHSPLGDAFKMPSAIALCKFVGTVSLGLLTVSPPAAQLHPQAH